LENPNNKKKNYVSVGGKPESKRDLDYHLNSRHHILRSASLTSSFKRLTKKKDKLKSAVRNHRSFISNYSDCFSSNQNDKNIISVIKDKLKIIIYMIKTNSSNCTFSSIQKLIDDIGNNSALKFFRHNSSTSFNNFLKILYNSYQKIIKNSINKFKYYGILCDDSTNVLNKNEILIYIIYLNGKMETTTSFLCLKSIDKTGATASNLLLIVKGVLLEWDLNINYMVSFTSDGGSNMKGSKKGLFELLRIDIPSLIDSYCVLHKLNLIMNDLFKMQSSIFHDCIQICFDISYFVNGGCTRSERFRSILNSLNPSCKIQIRKPNPTRWSGNLLCINSIFINFLPLLVFLHEEIDFDKTKQPENFLNVLNSKWFIVSFSVVFVILKEINGAIIKLQKANIDIGESHRLLKNLKLCLKNNLIQLNSYEICN
jgi:hypothetical protein